MDPKSFPDRQDKLGKAFYGAVLRTKPLWPYDQNVFHAFSEASYQPQRLQRWLVEVGLITYLTNPFWQFLSSFSLTFRSRRFHSIQFLMAHRESSLRPSTIGSSLHGGECVEGGYQGEASSVKSLHSNRWFCGNVHGGEFLCKALSFMMFIMQFNYQLSCKSCVWQNFSFSMLTNCLWPCACCPCHRRRSCSGGRREVCLEHIMMQMGQRAKEMHERKDASSHQDCEDCL